MVSVLSSSLISVFMMMIIIMSIIIIIIQYFLTCRLKNIIASQKWFEQKSHMPAQELSTKTIPTHKK